MFGRSYGTWVILRTVKEDNVLVWLVSIGTRCALIVSNGEEILKMQTWLMLNDIESMFPLKILLF